MDFTEIKVETFVGVLGNLNDGGDMPQNTEDSIADKNNGIYCDMDTVDEGPRITDDLYPFVCGLCCQKFNDLYLYFTHLKSHENIGMQNLQVCLDKDKLCIDKNGKFYQCELCESDFVTICDLHFHLIYQENLDSFVYHHSSKSAAKYNVDSSLNSKYMDTINDLIEKNHGKINDHNEDTQNSILEQTQNETQCETHLPEVVKSELNPLEDVEESCENNWNEDLSDGDDTDDYFSEYNKHTNSKKKPVKKKKRNVGKSNRKKNISRGKKQTQKFNRKYSEDSIDNTLEEKAQKLDRKCSEDSIDNTLENKDELGKDDKCGIKDQTETEKCSNFVSDENNPDIEIEDNINEIKPVGDDLKKTDISYSTSDVNSKCQTVKIRKKKSKKMVKKGESSTNEANSKPKIRRGGAKAQVDEFGNKIYMHTIRVPCHVCGGMYKRGNLRAHLTTHAETRNFQCDVCQKWYKSKMHLKMHKVHHRTEWDFVCRYCGKCFNTKGNLRQHEKTHTAKRLHECPICQAKFTSKYILKKHSLVHSDVKPFVCEICHQDFKRHYGLIKHRVLHQTERPFPCSVCGKMFKTQRDCDKHEMIHKPPKHFCRFCGKSTITRANMKIHEKIHLRDLKQDEAPGQ